MPKKDAAPEKTSPKPKKSKDVTVEPKDSEEPLDEIKEAPVKEKKSKKKVSKKRAKLSVLQAAVLETIRERPQRPGAIQTIIFRWHSRGILMIWRPW